eukprot:1054892-Pelagomonas_calceolata.AAC.1
MAVVGLSASSRGPSVKNLNCAGGGRCCGGGGCWGGGVWVSGGRQPVLRAAWVWDAEEPGAAGVLRAAGIGLPQQAQQQVSSV